MTSNLRKLILVSRPISWPNTAYPFAAGYLLSGGRTDLLFVLMCFYFLFPYNLLMYGINDVFDYESDIRNPRKGGIEGMKEQRSLHPVIVRAAIATNVPLLALFIFLISLVSAAILALIVFFVIAYSVAKLRFKERPILDSVTSSLHFVGPLIFALSLNGFPSSSWIYVLAFFIWGFASHAFGAVQDIIPDRQASISSIATYIGAKSTVRLAFTLYIIAATIISLQPWPYAIVGAMGYLYALNIYKYLNVSDKQSAKLNSAWRRFIWLNPKVGFVLTIILIIEQL